MGKCVVCDVVGLTYLNGIVSPTNESVDAYVAFICARGPVGSGGRERARGQRGGETEPQLQPAPLSTPT